MATADIRALLESRLHALAPNESLDPGSRAQVDFIQPIIDKFGTDPMETDIETFIDDRFVQEYPEIFAGNPSLVRDIFSKPLRTMLEPFKREINIIKTNQSLKDPTVLSDDDADALAANVFAERPVGNLASGVARVYYANPNNVQVEITNRFFTSDGLNFYASSPAAITAEQMVFNREGPLFYFDVSVQSEVVGAQYNIGPGSLAGVDGLYGVVKVTNPAKFNFGVSSVDTPTFIQQAGQSLTELSLVTRRGATARINKEFSGQVRAVQVIGAKDVEMERDLLVASSPGQAWLTGSVTLYQKMAFVNCTVVEGDPHTDVVNVGDTLYFYLSTSYSVPTESDRYVRLRVEEIISGPMDSSSPYRVCYLIRWSGTLPVTLTSATFYGGFRRTPTVQVSSIPTIGTVSASAPSGSVHVYGHTDIYVRPSLQPESKTILSGLYDYQSFIEGTTLVTQAAPLGTPLANCIDDTNPLQKFVGVNPGDVVVLEQGPDAGAYVVGSVNTITGIIVLTSNLSTPLTNIRYRVLKKIRVDPFNPRIPRYPFGGQQHSDLSTTIGSSVFTLGSVDIISYGARVGDTFRVTSGLDAGDFIITAISGFSVQMDRAATSTGTGLSYEVFTPLDVLSKPLVRIKSVELLDSAQQTTGITIPPAEPVAVVPTSDFTSARVKASSQGATGYILPDLTGIWPLTNFAASTGDRRYSMGFDTATGYYRSMLSADGSKAELDVRADAFGSCSYFIATVETGTTPPIDPNPGECLTIKNGPCKGSYLIKAVHKFKYKTATSVDQWVYFVQIYGTFPVDPFGQIINFLNTVGTSVPTPLSGTGDISFPGFFTSFLSNLGFQIRATLSSMGVSVGGLTTPFFQQQVLNQVQAEYEWGDPARGVLRTYMQEPTLVEQKTGIAATTFSFKTPSGDVVKFRTDPNFYQKQQILPSNLDGSEDPKTFPRDVIYTAANQVTLTDNTKPTPFSTGIQDGDILSIHTETFTTKSRAYGVSTVSGSAVVSDPQGLAQFTQAMTGNYLSIEEGNDAGMYRILSVSSDGNSLTLDQAMTDTTPSLYTFGQITNNGHAGANSHVGAYFDTTNDIVVVVPVPGLTWTGKYVTIYNMDFNYQGSFQITAAAADGTASPARTLLTVSRGAAAHFPLIGDPGHLTDVLYVVSDAPLTTPVVNTSGHGTNLYGVKSMRMYSSVPTDYTIVVDPSTYPDANSRIVNLTSSILDSTLQPYRIYRNGVRRVTPTMMAKQQEGAYVYFDTEVVSLAPQSAANIPNGSYLVADDDTFTSIGYRHTVTDRTLTYSTQEAGWVDMPLYILPVNNIDRSDSYIYLFGSPVLVTYEAADIVRSIQNFVDSPLDRVTVANILVRHFLPQYVSYDALYFGGSAPSVVAKTIIDNINGTSIETALDVSEQFEKAITNANGNPETPTKIMVLLHDWQRRRWLEISENKIGGVASSVPYDGSSRVAYYVPGPDMSGQTSVPYGERILLTRG